MSSLTLDDGPSTPAQLSAQMSTSPEKLSEKVSRIFQGQKLLVFDSSPSSTGSVHTPPNDKDSVGLKKHNASDRSSGCPTMTPRARVAARISALGLTTPTKKAVVKGSLGGAKSLSSTKGQNGTVRLSAVRTGEKSPRRIPLPVTPTKRRSPKRTSRSPTKSRRTALEDDEEQQALTTPTKRSTRSTTSPKKSYVEPKTSPEESEEGREIRAEWKAQQSRDRSRYISPFGPRAQQACGACQARMNGDASLYPYDWSCGLCNIERYSKPFKMNSLDSDSP